MCVSVYIGADHLLPLVVWDEASPGFHVRKLEPHEAPIRHVLSRAHVYYAGSHLGCGCGFAYGKTHPHEVADPLEDEQGRASVGRLREYIERELEAADLELYACTTGDERHELRQSTLTVTASLGGATFEFHPGEKLFFRRR